MQLNDQFLQRVRQALLNLGVEVATEKYMFGGMCFMIRGHMCLGIIKSTLMCRLGPQAQVLLAERSDCRPMDFTGKAMKGYVYVDQESLSSQQQLQFWLQLCLDFNESLPQKSKNHCRFSND